MRGDLAFRKCRRNTLLSLLQRETQRDFPTAIFAQGDAPHLHKASLEPLCEQAHPSLSLAFYRLRLPLRLKIESTHYPPTNDTPTATDHLRCQTSTSASSEYITVHFRCGRLVFLVSGPSASGRRQLRCQAWFSSILQIRDIIISGGQGE